MKKIFNIFLLLTSVCLMGCGGGDSGGGGEIVNTLNLTIDKTSINVQSSGITTSLSVTSNVTWSVSVPASWVTVSPASGVNNGVVEVRVDANTTADSRSTTITISGGGISKSISVSQDAAAASLTVNPETLDIKAEGDTKNVEITSNGSWTATSDQTWCKTNVKSGKGSSTLTITVDANSTSDARTASVIIKCSNIEKKVTIKQAAGEFIPSENDNGLPPTPAPKK